MPTSLSEETELCHSLEVSKRSLSLGNTEWSENYQRITSRIN